MLPAALYPLRRASSAILCILSGDVVPLELPRASCMEQSWNNVRAKTLMFSGLRAHTLFHRFEIFFRARRAPLKKVEERAGNSWVTIPLAKRLPGPLRQCVACRRFKTTLIR